MAARRLLLLVLGCLSWSAGLFSPCDGYAADLADLKKKAILGKYQEVIQQASEAIKTESSDEDWPLLLGRTYLTVGDYTNAQSILQTALEQYPFSLRLRLLGRQAAFFNGQSRQAQDLLDEVGQLANRRQWAYRDAPNLIALGQAALLMGVDPKKVLENTFDRAKKAAPEDREAYLASADVALDKNDSDLAAKLANEGIAKFPKDPDFHYRLAQAYSRGDRKAMLEELGEALDLNENHTPSYLLLADHLIDAEEYEEAEDKLARALKVNPHLPEAWAYRAVMAHLRNEEAKEQELRDRALAFYKDNPAVDHLIGRKLSQKYRFAEGAAYQRRALAFDTSYIPARSQLAQDLLRLGRDEEGWSMVEQVYQDDGYDVVAYNLATLKDTLSKFTTLTNQFFIVRMGSQESPVFGDRVLALLTRAHSNLCVKYGMELENPTIVEVFPDQKDFAVRTFGMPGGAGYLGVCFGRVITANSPSNQSGKAASWESVLWHEFCHVVTLQMTKNKMPRWLSEGISVFEERNAHPNWGQWMTPRYREMILGKDLRPIGDLSSAFMAPPSGEHLMFAYYQSSLVVQFLVEKYGFESLRKILKDLRAGAPINDAIARHSAPLKELDVAFAEYAKGLANALGPQLEWEKPEADDLVATDGLPSEWMKKNPKNYYALMQEARLAVKGKRWAEAVPPLEKLIEQFPRQTEPGNAYQLLAQVRAAQKDREGELKILRRWAAIDANAPDAYLRLMELGSEDKDWLGVLENVQRFLAVNPLAYQAYAYWGQAAEAAGAAPDAIKAWSTLLKLNPPDPAGAHFHLARLMEEKDATAARRHVLQALEEAPRFRDAHQLLLKLSNADREPSSSSLPLQNPAPGSTTAK